MKNKFERKNKSLKRKLRNSYKVRSGSDRPRLVVYRSNKYIYGQILDNNTGATITGISSKSIESKKEDKGKIDISFRTGEALAEIAKKKKISEVVFDRGCYKYHGRVKALAEGARKGGLKF
ncbi:MAG: 50S ribosomal protein L18 [Actinomycetota bacterium]|nr:50S ribosomal protein L18 [Actinomycetota bacterium]